MKLAITVAATGSYCYAMKTLARRVVANLTAAKVTEPGIAIIAGDKSAKCKDAVRDWKAILPEGWKVEHLSCVEEETDKPNYKMENQRKIAIMRGAAFTEARRHDPDLCWSLDSDTLPPGNALRCMIDMLNFDAGYYSISTCPYPNDSFLGGRGTQFNQIAPDFTEAERVLPDDLKAERAAINAEIEDLKKQAAAEPERRGEPPKEWTARKAAVEEREKVLAEKAKECPIYGNSIWAVIDKFGWRQRGWFESAYPGIGKGSVVPSDWCGFGCTLMGKEALALAHFEGYDGQGTEDLFIVWRRWWPAGLRINAIAHCPCDHVIWQKKKGGDAKEYTLIISSHETHGECIGHLRTRKVPWTEL